MTLPPVLDDSGQITHFIGIKQDITERVRSDAALQRHFEGATPDFRLEARLLHKDGQEVCTVSRGKVVQWDPQGRPLRIAGTQLDINTRKLAEVPLRQSNLALEQTNRQLV